MEITIDEDPPCGQWRTGRSEVRVRLEKHDIDALDDLARDGRLNRPYACAAYLLAMHLAAKGQDALKMPADHFFAALDCTDAMVRDLTHKRYLAVTHIPGPK